MEIRPFRAPGENVRPDGSRLAFFFLGVSVDVKKALRAYRTQEAHARARGIAWQFTFKTWVDWWGDDIEKRGRGAFDLQMQRVADRGPYHPDNVRKGTPRMNAATRGRMKRLRESLEGHARLQAEIDAADPVPSKEYDDRSDDELELHRMFAPKSSSVKGCIQKYRSN